MRVEISTEPTSESIDGYRVSIEVPDSAGIVHDALMQKAVATLQEVRLSARLGIQFAPGPGWAGDDENVPDSVVAAAGTPRKRRMEPRFLAILRGPQYTAEILANGHDLTTVEDHAIKWVTSHIQSAGTDLLLVDVMEIRAVDSIDGAKIAGEL